MEFKYVNMPFDGYCHCLPRPLFCSTTSLQLIATIPGRRPAVLPITPEHLQVCGYGFIFIFIFGSMHVNTIKKCFINDRI